MSLPERTSMVSVSRTLGWAQIIYLNGWVPNLWVATGSQKTSTHFKLITQIGPVDPG